MKKIKIPLEILYKLFNNKIEKVYTSNSDLKADQIIEQNKKYFNVDPSPGTNALIIFPFLRE